ncbi:MAG: glycosyltransferase [Planctomycetota bacterium]
MRIAIYEPRGSGHRFAYVGRLIPALAELAAEFNLAGGLTLITSREAIETAAYRMHVAPYADVLRVETLSISATPGKAGQRARVDALFEAVETFRPDHLYVPYGDPLILGVSLRTRTTRRATGRRFPETEVIVMRGKYAYPGGGLRGRWQGHVAKRALLAGPWSRVHHLDPYAVRRLGGDPENPAGRVRLLPDPIEAPAAMTKADARRLLGVPVEPRYVGLIGGVDARKGGDLLIKTFARAAERDAGLRLLLAGKIEHPAVRSLLEQEHAGLVSGGRIIALDRRLTEEEFTAAAQALDVVVTAYPDHLHSASVVTTAAAAGRPVVAFRHGWMGRTVEQFGLGATSPPGDLDALCQAVLRCAATADQHEPSEAARRYVRFQSVANFQAHATDRLREKLGAKPSPDLAPWGWVTAPGDGAEGDQI